MQQASEHEPGRIRRPRAGILDRDYRTKAVPDQVHLPVPEAARVGDHLMQNERARLHCQAGARGMGRLAGAQPVNVENGPPGG